MILPARKCVCHTVPLIKGRNYNFQTERGLADITVIVIIDSSRLIYGRNVRCWRQADLPAVLSVGVMRHLGSEVRWQQPDSMMDNAGEFRIAALFAVLEAVGPKSFGLEWTSWAVPPNTSQEQDGTRFSFSLDHASTPHPGAALCRRSFHRDSAAGGRLGGGKGRDLTILDLMDQST
jgi:hypothetical protein